MRPGGLTSCLVLALAAEMALKELQTSYDKIKADSDAAGTQLKAEMDVLKADAKKAADQLKECQDKNGGSVMKQKVSVH
jgi:ABC-type transporter MlaC component